MTSLPATSRASRIPWAVAALLLAAERGEGAAAAAPRQEVAVEIARLLAGCEEAASEEERAAGARALAQARGAAAVVLGALGGAWPAGGAGAVAELGACQRELLARAAPLLPRGEVLRAARAVLDEDGGPAARGAALDVLAHHALSTDLPLLVALALEEGTPADEGLLASFGAAVVATARRDPGLFAELGRHGVAPPPLRPALVRAVGRAGDPAGLPWLARTLDDPQLLEVALQEIGRLAASVPGIRDEGTARAVRPLLLAQELGVRRQAMRAAAALGDEQALPSLIARLQEARGGEQRDAHAALRRITGRELPVRADAWWAWYREERAWQRERAPDALRALASPQAGVALAAIREVSAQGLDRQRLAQELAPLLDHDEPAVRAQACLGLARLGAEGLAGLLEPALRDEAPEVRTSAARALASAQGQD